MRAEEEDWREELDDHLNDEDDVEDNDDDGDSDNDAMAGETRTKTIRRCARSLKEYTSNRPSMEYIIDNLLEIHLIQCCSMKDGLYDRRTNLTDDFHMKVFAKYYIYCHCGGPSVVMIYSNLGS